jgi:hypothetical protein
LSRCNSGWFCHSGGELQREVEEGRCWGGVGGVRAARGLIYRPRGRGERAGMGGSRASGRDARGQGASCEGEGTGRRRTGTAAGHTPAWRAQAASTHWHSEQQRPRRPWRDAGGAMRARVHSQQRGQRRVMRWPARARKERATARAGSTHVLI